MDYKIGPIFLESVVRYLKRKFCSRMGYLNLLSALYQWDYAYNMHTRKYKRRKGKNKREKAWKRKKVVIVSWIITFKEAQFLHIIIMAGLRYKILEFFEKSIFLIFLPHLFLKFLEFCDIFSNFLDFFLLLYKMFLNENNNNFYKARWRRFLSTLESLKYQTTKFNIWYFSYQPVNG